MLKRWDGDDRGHGLGDAAALIAGASELLQRLGLIDARADETDAYILELEWRGTPGSVGQARQAEAA